LRPAMEMDVTDWREEQIRRRAHQIWHDEGRPDGQADAHWKRAEEDIAVDRTDVADQTDYVIQMDEASRVATELEQKDTQNPQKSGD